MANTNFYRMLFIQENCFELFLLAYFLSEKFSTWVWRFADYVTGKIWFQVKFV